MKKCDHLLNWEETYCGKCLMPVEFIDLEKKIEKFRDNIIELREGWQNDNHFLKEDRKIRIDIFDQILELLDNTISDDI